MTSVSEWEIAERLCAALIRVNSPGKTRRYEGTADWTVSVINEIAAVIKGLDKQGDIGGAFSWIGGKTFSTKRWSNTIHWGSEWLFDITWLVYRRLEGDDWSLYDFPLAVECEWNTSLPAIHDDFLKLVVCRARLKVFIHQRTTSADSRSEFGLLDQFQKVIQSKLLGEDGAYLVCHWDNWNWKFHYWRRGGSSFEPFPNSAA
jgi:hypothetical protein